MKNELMISIVVLNYNGLSYLKRTIPSLINLDYSNYEILVVDNNSNDGSQEWLRNFNQIRIVSNPENYGYSKGKNIGIQEAKGEYILLLDNDILLNDLRILDKLVEYYITKNNNCLLSILLVNENEKETKYYGGFFGFYGINERTKISLETLLNYHSDIPISCPHGASLFIKREIWDSLHGYDESQPFNMDDVDIGPRAWLRGSPVYLFNQSYCTHLGSHFKNYKLINLLRVYPLFIVYSIFKTIKQTITRKKICVVKSSLLSVAFFLRNLSDTLHQRKIIQDSRTIKNDIFLAIKKPNFNLE